MSGGCITVTYQYGPVVYQRSRALPGFEDYEEIEKEIVYLWYDLIRWDEGETEILSVRVRDALDGRQLPASEDYLDDAAAFLMLNKSRWETACEYLTDFGDFESAEEMAA